MIVKVKRKYRFAGSKPEATYNRVGFTLAANGFGKAKYSES
jgi:hypothetical protein